MRVTHLVPTLAVILAIAATLGANAEPFTLDAGGGAVVQFGDAACVNRWAVYSNTSLDRTWAIAGPIFSVELEDGRTADLSAACPSLENKQDAVLFECELPNAGLRVRQQYAFAGDGTTLRIRTSLAALDGDIAVKTVTLLSIELPGQALALKGPAHVSSPVFGDLIFMGVEHPSAQCAVDGARVFLRQSPHIRVDQNWTELPGVVFGSATSEDVTIAGGEALRRAFLRYLDTVRWKPGDLHVHYNDWWTAPVPSSEEFVLDNLAALKAGLFEPTGFFFDSYAMDMGWSDPHTAWEIDVKQFPKGFQRVRAALDAVGARPGLWISPSSLYPPALDNAWLAENGYEVMPESPWKMPAACLARGGKYQTAFKDAILKHAKKAHLAHVKFDGYVARCSAGNHAHPLGDYSYLPLAEGIMDVFDALRKQDPDIVLEPTCFGYGPSPWWLMHTPFIIGPFGDDSPRGRVPCPEWIESMITARELKNLEGRDQFLMPSSALQCFDIIVQCPGPFQNLAAMAIGRGRWFISSYINPKFMEPDEWRFFADLIAWARHNKDLLQEPLPFGGNPANREAYGYAFFGPGRHIFCVRNPWIEEVNIELPNKPLSGAQREARLLYPRRYVIGRSGEAEPLSIRLGPYETQFIEVVPGDTLLEMETPVMPDPVAEWTATVPARTERVEFDPEPESYGPSWTSIELGTENTIEFAVEGTLDLQQLDNAELCILCEGPESVSDARCRVVCADKESPVRVSQSKGAFSAAGAPIEEHWTWFLAPVEAGIHKIAITVNTPAAPARCAVFVRGRAAASPTEAPFSPGPAFPLYLPESRPWSKTLLAPVTLDPNSAKVSHRFRRVETIPGIYLDALEWTEATAGWGEVQRNKSVMGQAMTMGGAHYTRGLGTHAPSRITFKIPEGLRKFAATIGYDQEVRAGSVVFVVHRDGSELYRSPAMRYDSAPIPVDLIVDGFSELTLEVEDAGDGITADHANWADARFLE